jgi:hypothetical protein
VNSGAFFGRLRRGRHGVEMHRQQEHKQNHGGADDSPKRVRALYAANKHGVEPKQWSFSCQWKMAVTARA